MKFEFEIKNTDGQLARTGTIKTPHGNILTPAFIAVGTKASVKAIAPEQLDATGVAYKTGITKLSDGSSTKPTKPAQRLARITDDGVTFKSHLDGSNKYLDPEISMQIQHKLAADIIFAFDECTAPNASYEYQKQALERTHKWAVRSLNEHKKLNSQQENYQALFGIVQGARYEDLRKYSAKTIGQMDFDGFGIGGAFNKNDLAEAVSWVTKNLVATRLTA